jgi:hypothetical protein
MLSSIETAQQFRQKIRQLLKSLWKGESVILPRQLADEIFKKINDTYNLSLENKLRLNNIEGKINNLPDLSEMQIYKVYKDKIKKLHEVTTELVNL